MAGRQASKQASKQEEGRGRKWDTRHWGSVLVRDEICMFDMWTILGDAGELEE